MVLELPVWLWGQRRLAKTSQNVSITKHTDKQEVVLFVYQLLQPFLYECLDALSCVSSLCFPFFLFSFFLFFYAQRLLGDSILLVYYLYTIYQKKIKNITFIHLKIILLQYFQFLSFNFSNNKLYQTNVYKLDFTSQNIIIPSNIFKALFTTFPPTICLFLLILRKIFCHV